jgi:hypothetical protein
MLPWHVVGGTNRSYKVISLRIAGFPADTWTWYIIADLIM